MITKNADTSYTVTDFNGNTSVLTEAMMCDLRCFFREEEANENILLILEQEVSEENYEKFCNNKEFIELCTSLYEKFQDNDESEAESARYAIKLALEKFKIKN